MFILNYKPYIFNKLLWKGKLAKGKLAKAWGLGGILNAHSKLVNAISGPPTSSGSKKLPNPPIKASITIKNIIRMACAVIILLYNRLSAIYWTPGPDNSSLINTEKAVPSNPENKANIRYGVSVSFALLDKNQRSHHKPISDRPVLLFFERLEGRKIVLVNVWTILFKTRLRTFTWLVFLFYRVRISFLFRRKIFSRFLLFYWVRTNLWIRISIFTSSWFRLSKTRRYLKPECTVYCSTLVSKIIQ